MFNKMFGKGAQPDQQPDQHPVPTPSPVVVTPTRQRNEKEMLMQQRTGGRGGARTRVPNFNLMEPGEVIVVDFVREEHGGFVYVAGLSSDKQTRHHQTKMNRHEAWNVAVAEHLRASKSMWADEAVIVRQRAIVLENTIVQGLK